jgi:hypothetical protein
MDWRHLFELQVAGRKVGLTLKNLIVWNKDNGGMGTFYRSKHELILVYKHGTAAHVNTFEQPDGSAQMTHVRDSWNRSKTASYVAVLLPI